MFGEWPCWGACYRDDSRDDLHWSNTGTKVPIAITPVSEVIGGWKVEAYSRRGRFASHKDFSWRMTISGFRIPIAAPIKQNEIRTSCCSKAFRARCFKGQRQGNTMTERTLAGKDTLTSTTLLSDQRGAVALEMPIVWLFMMICLLLPLADVAIAGFQFVSAWGALRAFGQYIAVPFAT